MLVPPEATIRQALAAINAARSQLALVVDAERRLLGTLSDGDIRRALLGDATLDDAVAPWMNSRPKVAHDGNRPEDILAMMRVHGMHRLPILDASSRVVGLSSVDDFLQSPERQSPVVIMAGGLGSRLNELTRDRPKPMLPVGGRPILETIIDRFVAQGFRDIWLAVNYRAEVIVNHFGDGVAFGARIRYLREEKRLGTAGALSLLPRDLAHPVVVSNADLLTSLDCGALVDAHCAARAEATMAVREQEHAIPFGVVTESEGRVLRIEEKPSQQILVNAGVYVLEPSAIRLVPDDTYYDMPQLLDELIRRERTVFCHRIDGYWLDIGRRADYERAQNEFGTQ
ncbi:Nucleoside-diphosphate-sugar pyrophosphorylase [uncultured Alphaproteobacteria bacterium]|uniref:Nucleoside-diphosphate-sugar pyrophosphorylase n=1 Tax=uncultured Alphaproteobacteria bacterium TaxID=91750 RepID=A0A212KDB8_9PROT|nr:Nucleoside-diphosphate-sugar pyrophosphorylase [uncultured Alphaproteobacteria bacterium]